MTLYTFAVTLDILAFGYLAFTNEKAGLFKNVQFFRSNIMETLAIFPSIISTVLILFSPGGLVRNIITILLLQFVVNHIIWGVIHGVVDGIVSNIRLNKFKKENGF